MLFSIKRTLPILSSPLMGEDHGGGEKGLS